MCPSISDPGTPSRRAFLAGTVAAAGGAVLSGAPAAAAPVPDDDQRPQPTAQPPDAELRGLLRQIDQRNIEATVRKLASFGTRHTLSSQDDPVRGIGAATDWIFAQMQGFAAASGGRMTVQRQSFVQPAGPRIPVPTVLTNVIATLHGDASPDRA